MDSGEPRRMGGGARFRTSLQDAQEQTAALLKAAGPGGISSREEIARKKKEIAKTSITFGNDTVNYETQAQTAVSGGRTPVSLAERTRQAAEIKAIKASLMQTNFTLGEDVTQYEPTSRMPAPTNIAEARGHMSPELAKAIKSSSINFGNHATDYTTVNSEAMAYRGMLTADERAQQKRRQAEMQLRLQKHSFTMGEDKTDYRTNTETAFVRYNTTREEDAARKGDIQRLTQEIKAAHFSLGHDQVEYQSNTHMAMEHAARAQSSAEPADAQRIRQMKLALQKTSFVIGDDPDYQ